MRWGFLCNHVPFWEIVPFGYLTYDPQIVSGKFLGIVGQDSSDSKSNWLHVDVFRFCFNHLRYILEIPLKWSVPFLQSWTSTGYSSNSSGSSATNRWFFPDIIQWQMCGTLWWEILLVLVLVTDLNLRDNCIQYHLIQFWNILYDSCSGIMLDCKIVTRGLYKSRCGLQDVKKFLGIRPLSLLSVVSQNERERERERSSHPSNKKLDTYKTYKFVVDSY